MIWNVQPLICIDVSLDSVPCIQHLVCQAKNKASVLAVISCENRSRTCTLLEVQVLPCVGRLHLRLFCCPECLVRDEGSLMVNSRCRFPAGEKGSIRSCSSVVPGFYSWVCFTHPSEKWPRLIQFQVTRLVSLGSVAHLSDSQKSPPVNTADEPLFPGGIALS